MAEHNKTGQSGEALAEQFLLGKGHELLARNFRFGRAEVDIITRDQGIVIFTEVKTRSSDKFGFPEEFVSRKKIRMVKEAAEEFMYRNGFDGEVRFDIISITMGKEETKIHHIEDAFFHED